MGVPETVGYKKRMPFRVADLADEATAGALLTGT